MGLHYDCCHDRVQHSASKPSCLYFARLLIVQRYSRNDQETMISFRYIVSFYTSTGSLATLWTGLNICATQATFPRLLEILRQALRVEQRGMFRILWADFLPDLRKTVLDRAQSGVGYLLRRILSKDTVQYHFILQSVS